MEYGKFNSAEELLKGYQELEKSFTHKCQQLSALEKQIITNQDSSGTNGESPSPLNGSDAQNVLVATESESAVPLSSAADRPIDDASVPASEPTPIERIRQYLDEHPDELALLSERNNSANAPVVMTSGGNVSMALPSRPKTIREASEMAKQYFK